MTWANSLYSLVMWWLLIEFLIKLPVSKIEQETSSLFVEWELQDEEEETQIAWLKILCSGEREGGRESLDRWKLQNIVVLTYKLSIATILKLSPYKLAELSSCIYGLVTGGDTYYKCWEWIIIYAL